jgi:hypothetical protein
MMKIIARQYRTLCSFHAVNGPVKTLIWLFVEALPVTLGFDVKYPYSSILQAKVGPLIRTGPQISRMHRFILRLSGYRHCLSMRSDFDDAENGCALDRYFNPCRCTADYQEQLLLGARYIDEVVRKNRKIFVHCRYGRHRAPSAVIAFLMINGDSLETAISVAAVLPDHHLFKGCGRC